MTSYHETGDGQRSAIVEGTNRDATKPVRPRRPASADGQLARVAALLRERRTRGLSSVEAISFNVLRLPNRCCELRKCGWIISSKREAATGCLRYFLVSEPTPNSSPTSPGPSSRKADGRFITNYAEHTREIEREAMPLFAEAPRT